MFFFIQNAIKSHICLNHVFLYWYLFNAVLEDF